MAGQTFPEQMRVPYFSGSRTIGFVEKPVPAPGPGQLLLRVRANALCGSELPQFNNGSSTTPGHEAAGEVVAAGPGTTTAVGTRGVVFLMDFCGECPNCRLGMTNQCLQKRADMGFTHDGGYGQYELIHETIFFPVEADLPLTEATMLLDVIGTSTHAVHRAQLVRQDAVSSVLIGGAGPVGLGLLAAVKMLLGFDTPVLITDIVPYRLELARRMGGIPVHVQETSVEAALHANGLQSVDLAVDASGKTAARRAELDALGKRGVLVCVGHGEGLNLAVSADLIATERAILGSEYFTYAELPENLRLLRAHFDYLKPIITHRFPVEDIQQAFELFFSGNTGKVIIEQ